MMIARMPTKTKTWATQYNSIINNTNEAMGSSQQIAHEQHLQCTKQGDTFKVMYTIRAACKQYH